MNMVSHLKEYTLFKKENKFSKFNIKDSDDKDRWNINVIEDKLVDVKLEITFNIVSSSHSPLMLLGGYKNTTGRWDKTRRCSIYLYRFKFFLSEQPPGDRNFYPIPSLAGGPGIPFLSSFVIIGNADVTHGNGTEASDFDMRIGAEASHYFVYGKNANYASVEVELIERYGFKSYTGKWNFDEPDDGHKLYIRLSYLLVQQASINKYWE
ncbi:hypothetical protein RhiirA4_541779 [Rhizophagus irregularis]|uniref:Uncharacterized protein n=1 Tax=Rhizophagus irregularis TaxID=588596 RepID=A0A2I1GCI5_9GLOM|nr:hypothetical protein RhiirA4_541779 [Rhizophagus irregularis]